MEREGIYVGNKEVSQRYIGVKLVWEKIKLLFNGNVSISYDRNNSRIILSKDFSQNHIKAVEISGQNISISSVENKQDKTYITFNESVAKFEQKTGFNQYRSYYGSIPVKIYGR